MLTVLSVSCSIQLGFFKVEEETNFYSVTHGAEFCFPGFSASVGFLLQGPLENGSWQALFSLASEPTVTCGSVDIHSSDTGRLRYSHVFAQDSNDQDGDSLVC